MPMIRLIMNGDNAMSKEEMGKVIHLTDDFTIMRLKGGMQSGKSSLMLRINLPDGRIVLQETSVDCFTAAARAFKVADEAGV